MSWVADCSQGVSSELYTTAVAPGLYCRGENSFHGKITACILGKYRDSPWVTATEKNIRLPLPRKCRITVSVQAVKRAKTSTLSMSERGKDGYPKCIAWQTDVMATVLYFTYQGDVCKTTLLETAVRCGSFRRKGVRSHGSEGHP